ncbi:hypothetical protein I3760_08G050400 [Carya illinoinensis]|nr:hypothetical protein I3760_08G050400 [Carya illinoinensis]KAG2692364.1 hypothetical protein I3760_08G050400 [Carya illinoinensis]KAG2692369.1 hypothetical protein I3760_08G050400 [Carya illinoinensis]
MAKQANTVFLEEWLRSISGGSSNVGSSYSSPSSARAIIQAWAELRDSLQHQSFRPHHLQSLKTLLNSQTSLHVADPQAKIILSIVSSANLSLPPESYPFFLRLLYIWVRKSFKPSLAMIDSTVGIISQLFKAQSDSIKSPLFFSEGVLLLGALSLVPSVSESSKIVCLDMICRLLREEYQLIGSSEDLISYILAGMGYALSSSVNVHYVKILDFLLGIWGREGGLHGSVSHGLMILHLIEWVLSGLINVCSFEKINVFAHEALETSKANYVPFVVVMAAAGALRALNKSTMSGLGLETVSGLRISAENRIESVARNIISRSGVTNLGNDLTNSFLLQCFSLALARSGLVSSKAPLLICLASALLTEIFPLRRLYTKLLDFPHANSVRLRHDEVKKHVDSVPFKEAGVITGVFCNLYTSVDVESKCVVENLLWDYCQDIYLGHRRAALLLQGREDELLRDMEKIAESAFLMVVFFALAVTKYKLNTKFSQETHKDIPVRILVSFSCLEYFRRIRLPEYMDTIRRVVGSVQENESAIVSFVESMPSYTDLTNGPDLCSSQKMEYVWYKDGVQTARILFYLRVIPTCIERVPIFVLRKVVAPTMFLHMGHPNGKVARASHSMFSALISSGKDSDQDERVSLKEQLAFYYMQRSLLGYPSITPFEGMASGVAALVHYLPAGSPAIFYCVHSLVEKANTLCSDIFSQEVSMGKNWHGESEPCKKILDLLLRLISLVDIQVLPHLMKLLAQLVVQLPKDGQNMVLNELYSQVAESDDVTRKPSLVSWLQSLSYLCAQAASGSATYKGMERVNMTSAWSTDSLSLTKLNARL